MAKNKLKKFEDLKELPNTLQPTIKNLRSGFYLKGNWQREFFRNNNPIVLELGCGKGEYSIGLAKKYLNINFIGIDIKGARIWSGAREAYDQEMKNVAFLRIPIEFIDHCFGKNEIDEIWITFPDPQLKLKRAKKRLTHPNFLNLYSKIIKKDGMIHLKTDSQRLYLFTLDVIQNHEHTIFDSTSDLYSETSKIDDINIKTYYEQKFLKKGKSITYVRFSLNFNSNV